MLCGRGEIMQKLRQLGKNILSCRFTINNSNEPSEGTRCGCAFLILNSGFETSV